MTARKVEFNLTNASWLLQLSPLGLKGRLSLLFYWLIRGQTRILLKETENNFQDDFFSHKAWLIIVMRIHRHADHLSTSLPLLLSPSHSHPHHQSSAISTSPPPANQIARPLCSPQEPAVTQRRDRVIKYTTERKTKVWVENNLTVFFRLYKWLTFLSYHGVSSLSAWLIRK